MAAVAFFYFGGCHLDVCCDDHFLFWWSFTIMSDESRLEQIEKKMDEMSEAKTFRADYFYRHSNVALI